MMLQGTYLFYEVVTIFYIKRFHLDVVITPLYYIKIEFKESNTINIYGKTKLLKFIHIPAAYFILVI